MKAGVVGEEKAQRRDAICITVCISAHLYNKLSDHQSLPLCVIAYWQDYTRDIYASWQEFAYNGVMSKKLADKKISGSHTTVIDAAYDLVKEIHKDPMVEKISLGIIRQCSPGRGLQNIKIKNTISGLELVVRGNSYVQNIYVYISDTSEVAKANLSDKVTGYFFAKRSNKNRV